MQPQEILSIIGSITAITSIQTYWMYKALASKIDGLDTRLANVEAEVHTIQGVLMHTS